MFVKEEEKGNGDEGNKEQKEGEVEMLHVDNVVVVVRFV